MTEKQVKAYFAKTMWSKFSIWFAGQTAGTNKDGTIDFYTCDVERFAEAILERKPAYFD